MRRINDRWNRLRFAALAGAAAGVIAGQALAQEASPAPASSPSVEEHLGSSKDAPPVPLPLLYDRANYEFSPGESSEAPLSEIDEAAGARIGMFSIPGLTPAVESWRLALDELYAATGLRLAFAYTTLFQQATTGGSDSTTWSGDLDLMSDWTLIGRGTLNPGRLIFTGEYRHQIYFDPPSTLRNTIGSLQGTTGGFNDRGWAVRDLHFTQSFFDGRFRLLGGRADVSDYVGGHRLQGINGSFSNRTFSADSTTAYPSGHVTTLMGSVRPVDWLYVTGGAANAYGTSTINDMQYLDEHRYFTFGEVGVTPVIPKLGWGRYALLLWHMDERELNNQPSDSGFTVIAEQDLTEGILLYARYGWADSGVLTGNKQGGQIGVGFEGLLGDPRNLTGLAIGVTEPTAAGQDPETVFEVFQRFQITAHSQFSIGYQSIFGPSRSSDDYVGVLSLRLRIAF